MPPLGSRCIFAILGLSGVLPVVQWEHLRVRDPRGFPDGDGCTGILLLVVESLTQTGGRSTALQLVPALHTVAPCHGFGNMGAVQIPFSRVVWQLT